MVGQAGIGKSTFLKNFPDSKKMETVASTPTSQNNNKETFKFNCINTKQAVLKPESAHNYFDSLDVEITNYDITTDTYLNTADIGDLEFSSSASIVDASSFKIVVLAFAMDDPNSFELIRSKWETELRKNIKFNYILVGLKSDIASQKINGNKDEASKTELLSSLLAGTKKKTSNIKKSNTFVYKKRSCSINSNSSTSKLQMRKRHSFSETEALTDKDILSKKIYKTFAKQIGADYFIESTCLETVGIEKSIDTYTMFAQNICSIFNSAQFLSSSKSLRIDDASSNSPRASTISDRIPKSLSAPINYLVNRRKTIARPGNLQLPDASFSKLENNEASNEVNNNNNNNLTVLKADEKVPIKEKFSRLFLGLGTYIVTCGSARSRKLVLANRMKNIRNTRTTNDLNSAQVVDKSWLLLSSHNSLNSLDDVFTSS